MAVNLVFRHLSIGNNQNSIDKLSINDTVITETNASRSGLIGGIVGSLCSLVVTIELISLPAMILYLVHPIKR
jgi:hypothetical protein